MRASLKKILILLGSCLFLVAQPASRDSLRADSLALANNPLEQYLKEINEMGRTLSKWDKGQKGQGSWFFGSYAMLLLSNNGRGENVPIPAFESVVPGLWKDFKYLTPRYLVELAGGALSHGDLMSIQEGQIYKELKAEERFILVVAGFGYLRMLQGTIGDSLFNVVVDEAVKKAPAPRFITAELTASMARHCCQSLAEQFEIALNSSRWCDVHLGRVDQSGDSLSLDISFLSSWRFPVEVLVIETSGDSSRYEYGLDRTQPLVVDGQDVEKVILDPDHLLTEYYRYNNQWPRLKDRVFLQPFGALPDWNNYRFTATPTWWSDWDGEKRLGIRINSGFGVDLWPAYPSDFRHRVSLEVNTHSPMDESVTWGSRLDYGHALDLERRMFSQIRLHYFDDWAGVSLGLTRYIGKQSFLVQGSRLTYQRVGLALEYDRYGDHRIWARQQEITILKASYSALSMTRQGNRFYLRATLASGEGPHGGFSIFKAQTDLSGVSWGWFVGGLQVVSGFQSQSTPSPYEFSHSPAWQDALAAVPVFRGQTKLLQNTNEYLGAGVSAGYWLSGIQLKLFTSSMIVDMDDIGWDAVKPHYAAGFGFEHNSIFTAGLYFPIWQSHPLEGEEPWAWRVQTRLTWNL